jgi:methylmalonyl-CoA/ethylmalonyl-CoA epimerase
VKSEGDPHQVADLGDRDLWLAFFRDSEGNVMALMEEKPHAS